MKTDDEMIKSLFKRREEYYNGLKQAKVKKGGEKRTVLKIIGRIALPVAAAGAVALTAAAVQKNIANDTVDINMTDGVNFTPITEQPPASEEEIISAQMLLKLYESDRSKLCDDFKALDFATIPLCISHEGKIYKSDYYMTLPDAFNNDYIPAVSAEDSSFSVAGTAKVLESADEFLTGECTVFNVIGHPEYMAAVVNGRIELYRETGASARTVGGIEFEITAFHRTAEKYIATYLPVLREDGDVIYRAYNNVGMPVKDAFILYTPDLTGFDSEYAVWEVTGEIPDELLGDYPALKFISIAELVELVELSEQAKNGKNDLLKNAEVMCANQTVSDELKSTRYQLYYIDELNREYIAEIYTDSDEAVLTTPATNESIPLKEGGETLDNFLMYGCEPALLKTNYSLTEAMTVKYGELKSLVEKMNGGNLTKDDIIRCGGVVWNENPNRLDLFYAGNDADYWITAVIGEDERVRYFNVSRTNSDTTFVIDTVSAFNELFGYSEPDLTPSIDYTELCVLAENTESGALDRETLKRMGAAENEYGIYELYFDLYSEVYFRIEISFDGEELSSACITDTDSGDMLDMELGASRVKSFVSGEEETAYQKYKNNAQYISYDQLKELAEMAADKTLTVKYAESIGAKYIADGTSDALLFYNGVHFRYEIYISATVREGVKSVTLTNAELKYLGDEGLDLVNDGDRLDWYLNRYLIDCDRLRDIAEKCGKGTVSAEDFTASGARECVIYKQDGNGNLLSETDRTEYVLYCENYKITASVKDGKVLSVMLTYSYDTIDVGIDLMTDYKQLEVFLGNSPFPDVYGLDPITDQQLGELIAIINGSSGEVGDDRLNAVQSYIKNAADHLVSGDFYDTFQALYVKDGKKYVITCQGDFYSYGIEMRESGERRIDLLNNSEKLEEFLNGSYSD